MIERIFNLFLIGNEDKIFQIGCMSHLLDGSDEEKRDFLLARTGEDFYSAEKIILEFPVSWEYNYGKQRLINDVSMFEPFFQKYSAIPDPFSVRTTVVNGQIKVDGVHGGNDPLPIHGGPNDNELFGQQPYDYLSTYIKDGGFDITQLLYDDHFEAIKILYNEGKLISSLKLLMIFIDTLGFLEAGYYLGPQNFVGWLDKYVDLSSVGITSIELWEFRNGVLHMTNTESKKNRTGYVDRLIPRVSPKVQTHPVIASGFKHFEILGLIQAVGNGIAKWAESFNDQRDKFPEFVTRYDTLMSDRRRIYLKIDG